jgi:hypothetical protein
MSAKRPVNITVKRLKGDTYAEKFSVTPWPDTITGASLEVEGLGTSVGVLDAVAKTIEFPVDAPIADGLGSAQGTAYDYDVVITAGGATRTIVEGSWLIIDRAVT